MSDDELERGIKTLVVEATRDTPRMPPEQVAARAAAERRGAMEAIYRRSPGLHEAVTEIARRVQRKQSAATCSAASWFCCSFCCFASCSPPSKTLTLELTEGVRGAAATASVNL